MAFTTKGVDTTETRGLDKYIKYGIGKYKINDIEVKTASTGSKQCIIHMETPPVTLKGFEGVEGHKGQVGKVRMPKTYMNKDTQLEAFVKNIAIIGDKLGKRAEIDAIVLEGLEDLDNYVSKVKKVISGKYLNWKISGQQYWNQQTQKKGDTLYLPNFSFVASLEEGPEHLKFDKSKDYEEVQVPDSTTADQPVDSTSPWA